MRRQQRRLSVEVVDVSEQPRGLTGERCKADGTYVSEGGGKQYFKSGETFGTCPEQTKETRWEKVT
jgi:hypothetical protein